jgi:hypothetical protein
MSRNVGKKLPNTRCVIARKIAVLKRKGLASARLRTLYRQTSGVFAVPTTLDPVTEIIQGDQKVSVHLIITLQEVTCNVQSIPLQAPDIY